MSHAEVDDQELEALRGCVRNVRGMFEKTEKKNTPPENAARPVVKRATTFKTSMASHESMEMQALRRQRELRDAEKKAGEEAIRGYRQSGQSVMSAELEALRRHKERREAEKKAQEDAMRGYQTSKGGFVSAETKILQRQRELRKAEKKAEEDALKGYRESKGGVVSAETKIMQRQRELREAEKKAGEEAMKGYRQRAGGVVFAEQETLRRQRQLREAERKAEEAARESYRKPSASIESSEMAVLRHQREMREAERKAEESALKAYRQPKNFKTLLDLASDSQKQRGEEERRIAQASRFARSASGLHHDHVYAHAQKKKELEARQEREAKESLRSFSSGKSFFDVNLDEKKRRDEEEKKKEMATRAAIENNGFTSADLDKSYVRAKELARLEKEAEEKAKASLLNFSSADAAYDRMLRNGGKATKSVSSTVSVVSADESLDLCPDEHLEEETVEPTRVVDDLPNEEKTQPSEEKTDSDSEAKPIDEEVETPATVCEPEALGVETAAKDASATETEVVVPEEAPATELEESVPEIIEEPLTLPVTVELEVVESPVEEPVVEDEEPTVENTLSPIASLVESDKLSREDNDVDNADITSADGTYEESVSAMSEDIQALKPVALSEDEEAAPPVPMRKSFRVSFRRFGRKKSTESKKEVEAPQRMSDVTDLESLARHYFDKSPERRRLSDAIKPSSLSPPPDRRRHSEATKPQSYTPPPRRSSDAPWRTTYVSPERRWRREEYVYSPGSTPVEPQTFEERPTAPEPEDSEVDVPGERAFVKFSSRGTAPTSFIKPFMWKPSLTRTDRTTSTTSSRGEVTEDGETTTAA